MRDADPPLRGLHVLVVEHDRDSRDVLQQALEFFGARVTAVGDAEEARRRLESTPPDVLVVDIESDGESGGELSVWLRARPSPRISRLPVIALAAQCEDLGAEDEDGFAERLLKPVRAHELCAAILRAASVGDRHGHRHRT